MDAAAVAAERRLRDRAVARRAGPERRAAGERSGIQARRPAAAEDAGHGWILVRAQPRGAAAAALRCRLSIREGSVHLRRGHELGGHGAGAGGEVGIVTSLSPGTKLGVYEIVGAKERRCS